MMARPLFNSQASGDSRQLMSAAADGHADSGDLRAALKAWQAEPEARSAWHEYHLIGDVLRNEELARSADADEAFLHALRARLADEPRVLAPMPAAAAGTAVPRWRWAAPAAAAAACMGLASVLVVSRLGAAPTGPALALAPVSAPALASAPAPMPTDGAQARGVAAVTPVLGAGLVREADGQLVRRDERLDAYLRAHRDTAAANLPWPGASVRSASTPLAPNGR